MTLDDELYLRQRVRYLEKAITPLVKAWLNAGRGCPQITHAEWTEAEKQLNYGKG